MSFVRLVETTEVPPDIQKVFESGEAQYGQVLNTWRAIAHNPAIFGAYLPYLRSIFAPGALDARIKGLTALYVGMLNHCRYTVSHRANAAKLGGATEADLTGLHEFENGDYTEAEKVALAYTRELTLNPTTVTYAENKQAVSAATLDAVKAHFGDAEIVELTINVGIWNALARFHRVMDLDLDMPPPPAPLDEAL